MAVQGRFYIDQVTKRASFVGVEVTMRASIKGGNEAWSKWTPSGTLSMTVTDPGTAGWFESHLGKDVSLTFGEIEE